MRMQFYFFLFLILLVEIVSISSLNEDMKVYKPEKCYKECKSGGCLYTGCVLPKCTGGSCYFYECKHSMCSGGSCIFDRCEDSTCDGGRCNFKNPKDTLKAGYCRGHSCTIDGYPFPDMVQHVSY